MSAESPKRFARALPAVVPPEPVSDRTIIESVTGFINEVTLTSVPPADPKEQIQWLRFETSADVGNPSFGEDWDLETGVPPPLLLILGYGNGIQVWSIPANGEATEVLSWRHGVVRSVKLLPTPIPSNGEDANETNDNLYGHKRPLMAICDSSQMASTAPQFCTMNIVSLRDGDSVKSIKFKTTILEIAANHQSIVVTFAEKIAIFDARTLEDRLTITTCHPSPGLSPNPIALGPRWLAYAERKMMQSKRSAGGCDCDGVSSYTATVLNAAKTLGKGLRELGEHVAYGLTGTASTSTNTIANANIPGNEGQQLHPGIVTILDIKYPIKDTSPTTGAPITVSGSDPIIAHFVAHAEVIAGMAFDASGMLLLTADKRGHDFHVFRIHPHPCGSASASVHHLYILHRGDTTAKVQDMIFSLDSRWVAVTTARGTSHVFPVNSYGGVATYRTHGSAEVVNRLSRFHRSAGLSADGRSSSPVLHFENGVNADPYHNPRLPPFPRPHVVMPLKQLRQPLILLPGNSSSATPPTTNASQRQRLSSVSDDSGNVFRVCTTFARARDWLLQPLNSARDIPTLRNQRNAVDSLFVMAGHGAMIQYDLEPRYISSIPASKQNDDSPIELHVEAKAQWNLLRKDTSIEIQPPLSPDNWLLKNRMDTKEHNCDSDASDNDERWLSQVEIVTSSGPHRRLWMGPQFIFKTYNTPSGSPLQHIDSEAVEIGVNAPANRPARSNPMPMPPIALGRGIVPVLIESGSASSFEQSPRLVNQYQDYMGSDEMAVMPAETQLREDLADAMRESPRDSGLSSNQSSSLSSTSSTASSTTSSARSTTLSVAKVVNPLGTVTTITESSRENILAATEFSEEYSSGAYIHENCDEAMFRPYVAVISGTIGGEMSEVHDKPEPIGQKLIVPVIDATNLKQEREKTRTSDYDKQQAENVAKFEQMSLLNRKDKDSEASSADDGKKKSADKSKSAKEKEKKDDNGKSTKNDDSIAQSKNGAAKNRAVDESADAKSSGKSAEVKSTPTADHCDDETEVVTIKLKKKTNKSSASTEEVKLPSKSDGNRKNSTEKAISEAIKPTSTAEVTIDKPKEVENVAEVPPKNGKSRKKSIVESEKSSKESSVEKDPTPEESTKSRKKKQKKIDKMLAEAVSSSASSSDDTKSEKLPIQIKVKTPPISPIDSKSKSTSDCKEDQEDFAILEDFEKADSAQCAKIQESLLKSHVVTAFVRKGSTQEDLEFVEVGESSKSSTKSSKKKKSSKDSIDNEPIVSISPKGAADELTEFTYPEPEPMTDLDSLSFKSTTDDPISLINLDNPPLGTEPELMYDKYDKLSDDVECGGDAQFSDCKSFQLVIDEPESYVKTSDTNSSDETEDSSQSKSTKSEKTIDDDDDEELQPLIGSTTSQSDAAVDLSKTLPDELSQSDSMQQQQETEQVQQQPQKQQQQSNNNNKKKFRKKRR